MSLGFLFGLCIIDFVIHLQEFLSNSLPPNTAENGSDTKEKQQNDERSAGKPQGWLNWLSLGMLGAGGTADSSQFAGVVSDEMIKVFLVLHFKKKKRKKLFLILLMTWVKTLTWNYINLYGFKQDIYEATKFHPVPSSDRGLSVKDKVYLSSIKFNIHQIVASLGSKYRYLSFIPFLVSCLVSYDVHQVCIYPNNGLLVKVI